jgi:hypothetical protein
VVGTAQDKQTGDNSVPGNGVVRKMAGYQKQIASGNITYTGAGPAAFSETSLLANLQIVFNAGGDPTRIHVTAANSLVLAGLREGGWPLPHVRERHGWRQDRQRGQPVRLAVR